MPNGCTQRTAMGECVTSVANHLYESAWDDPSQNVADEEIQLAGNFLADTVSIEGPLDDNVGMTDRVTLELGPGAQQQKDPNVHPGPDIHPPLPVTAPNTVAPPPLAQVLYHVKREGVRDFCPTPVEGAIPWKELVQVPYASLDVWSIRLGDIVTVCQGEQPDGYAKVSDLRSLENGRYMVTYTWLYTREEIMAEFQTEDGFPPHLRKNLEQRWPEDAHYHYMISTNRTITLWDTAVSLAPEEVVSRVCYSSIYSTTPTKRWIWSVENPGFRWMRKILAL
ncbi:uncharacterized protein LDX57_009345 [Aspergillus melleus]|uniref:uncharacterized protein n=1 Tax=Aspergillus melleus TaxID=138277 RepID=UPI001E8E9EBA|nr:uncharacterized protein LDX57_009345 [Aspergillus melleus]KAH8431691.1 hypothetical protein LDX57_009345 [Aspergillus melleus]